MFRSKDVITESCLTAVVDDRAYYELPILNLKSKKNNMIATLSDCNGRILAKTSCGVEGFHHTRKTSSVAIQTVGLSIGLKARKLGIASIRVKFDGYVNKRLVSFYFFLNFKLSLLSLVLTFLV